MNIHLMKQAAKAIFLLLISSHFGVTQTIDLSGRIIDNDSIAIKDVIVRLRGAKIADTTNANGEFRLLKIPTGFINLKNWKNEIPNISDNMISFYIQERKRVSLNLYDVRGGLAKKVFKKHLGNGSHKVPIIVNENTTKMGLYIVRLSIGEKNYHFKYIYSGINSSPNTKKYISEMKLFKRTVDIDTLEISKEGLLSHVQAVSKYVDTLPDIIMLPIFPNVGTIHDSRDGETYNYVTIGNQIWMAENLKFDPLSQNNCGSTANTVACLTSCPGDGNDSNCIDGPLYSWTTAMNVSRIYNNIDNTLPAGLIKGICPEGWHIPSNNDWNILFQFVDSQNENAGIVLQGCGGSDCWENVAKYLRSQSGWENNTFGLDSYGFNAIPTGAERMNGHVCDLTRIGANYWTSTEHSSFPTFGYQYGTCSRGGMSFVNRGISKNDYISVRCLKD